MAVLCAKIKVFHVRIETKGQWECTFDQLLISLGWNESAESSFREITQRCARRREEKNKDPIQVKPYDLVSYFLVYLVYLREAYITKMPPKSANCLVLTRNVQYYTYRTNEIKGVSNHNIPSTLNKKRFKLENRIRDFLIQ